MPLVVEYLLFVFQENNLILKVLRAYLGHLLEILAVVEAISARGDILIKALVGNRVIGCGVHLVLL